MLSVDKISFSYSGDKTISDISFSIEKGECLAIVGESGCGKSTLLKLIYGLHDLDDGNIFWNGGVVLGPRFNLIPGMDNMKYLAQDFDLMPYITVAENVGKFLSNIHQKSKKARIAELLALVEMSDFADIKAKYLSGGQMQRVAIARVLALEPELILFDEPFSHIDTFRKNSLRRKVISYLKHREITCIIASHDRDDILGFSDQTLVLKNGKLVAFGPTKLVYRDRSIKYVASLFDDVNCLSSSLLNLPGVERQLYIYPYELKVVENSNLEVEVVRSFFRGNGYLIESITQDQTIFFESKSELDKNGKVFLALEH